MAMQVTGVPPRHVPVALQASTPLQELPSEQLVPDDTGVCVTPLPESHASIVHGFPSSGSSGVPARHVPVALHVSVPLHAFPSLQLVPGTTETCVTPVTGSIDSVTEASLPSAWPLWLSDSVSLL